MFEYVTAFVKLAFFLMCVANNRGPQVWLCIAIAMPAIGSLQAACGKCLLSQMQTAVHTQVCGLPSR